LIADHDRWEGETLDLVVVPAANHDGTLTMRNASKLKLKVEFQEQ